MPPHCDSLDGPVVIAAVRALEADDPSKVLPFVPKHDEKEVLQAFADVKAARALGPQAKAVADRYFFETVVRIHRAGEGAAYMGLKPAGLDTGPVIPAAEQAIETGAPEDLVELLTQELDREVRHRLAEVLSLKRGANGNVDANRRYVEAALGFQVWAHSLHAAVHSRTHEHAHTEA